MPYTYPNTWTTTNTTGSWYVPFTSSSYQPIKTQKVFVAGDTVKLLSGNVGVVVSCVSMDVYVVRLTYEFVEFGGTREPVRHLMKHREIYVSPVDMIKCT